MTQESISPTRNDFYQQSASRPQHHEQSLMSNLEFCFPSPEPHPKEANQNWKKKAQSKRCQQPGQLNKKIKVSVQHKKKTKKKSERSSGSTYRRKEKLIIFVGCLPGFISEAEVRAMGQRYQLPGAKIFNIRIKNGSKNPSAKNSSSGFGTFEASSRELYSRLISDQQFIKQRPITCRPYFVGKQKVMYLKELKKRRVFIKNIPKDFGEAELKELFSQFGPVERAYPIKNYRTGHFCNYGYVNFLSSADAEKAIKVAKVHAYAGNFISCFAYKNPGEKNEGSWSSYKESSEERFSSEESYEDGGADYHRHHPGVAVDRRQSGGGYFEEMRYEHAERGYYQEEGRYEGYPEGEIHGRGYEPFEGYEDAEELDLWNHPQNYNFQGPPKIYEMEEMARSGPRLPKAVSAPRGAFMSSNNIKKQPEYSERSQGYNNHLRSFQTPPEEFYEDLDSYNNLPDHRKQDRYHPSPYTQKWANSFTENTHRRLHPEPTPLSPLMPPQPDRRRSPLFQPTLEQEDLGGSSDSSPSIQEYSFNVYHQRGGIINNNNSENYLSSGMEQGHPNQLNYRREAQIHQHEHHRAGARNQDATQVQNGQFNQQRDRTLNQERQGNYEVRLFDFGDDQDGKNGKQTTGMAGVVEVSLYDLPRCHQGVNLRLNAD